MEAIKQFFLGLGENAVPIAIFMVELLIAVLLLGGFIKLMFSRTKQKNEKKGKDIYYHMVEKGNSEVHIVIRRKDLYPVFCSKNIEGILNLRAERFQGDVELIKNIADEADYERFKKMYYSWDGAAALKYRFNRINSEQCFKIEIVRSEDEKYDFITVSDVTDSKKYENSLEAKIKELEEESSLKTSFLSRMSHEIRTPMNGIIGMISLCKKQIENKEAVLGYIDKAENLSKYLLSVINDILDISRIEAGKIELEEKEIDLIEFANKLSDMFKKNIEEKGVKFTVDTEDIKDRYVVGDELRLSQVMVNLLSNASKFTKEGEINVTIREMNKEEGKANLVFRVHDTGKGMKPEFVTRIFNPFEQENKYISRNYGGSGLGMAITDQIVSLMGGQIVIDTMEGVGSDFSVFVTLPIAKHESEGVAATKRLDIDEFSYKDMKILLAEDNEINAEISINILENEGAKVDLAVDGSDVVERFKKSSIGYYDFILMDIQMPIMNGWDATKIIRGLNRKDAKEIPIFALSADAYVEEQRHSREIGMNGHFSKPVNFEEMKKEIGRQLHTRKEN